jgi:hypothetical protein
MRLSRRAFLFKYHKSSDSELSSGWSCRLGFVRLSRRASLFTYHKNSDSELLSYWSSCGRFGFVRLSRRACHVQLILVFTPPRKVVPYRCRGFDLLTVPSGDISVTGTKLDEIFAAFHCVYVCVCMCMCVSVWKCVFICVCVCVCMY